MPRQIDRNQNPQTDDGTETAAVAAADMAGSAVDDDVPPPPGPGRWRWDPDTRTHVRLTEDR
ncbi:hypothetical protein ruthe_02116 [Rubellimicrobium thermophilum DSM 16684]|uniref:Uncharacterized protein n=1 Tax=Rubellimicrobium thermophilum DSM 16684 TaxID=1123069 RepID=S9QTB1_9RHOB|nr:hypothetical protein [Rubellimicrobium thermophilum]EPX84571.1 hypothetical protein ruthe_02116 [Rubellimicrobium thermophilum DSM 16684]